MTDDEKKFSQADVDRIVQDRLAREKEKYTALAAENETLKATIAEHEKTTLDSLRKKVATDLKLPPNLSGRLQGKTEAELRADGESLLKDLGTDDKAKGGAGNPPGNDQKPITKESIKAMTPEEVQANLPKIKEALKAGALK
jgi:hypothetical protein